MADSKLEIVKEPTITMEEYPTVSGPVTSPVSEEDEIINEEEDKYPPIEVENM